MSSAFVYGGQELDLFAQARNGTRSVQCVLWPYVCGDVLVDGAGIGTTMRLLCDAAPSTWTCIEPDAAMNERLRKIGSELPAGVRVELINGTLADVPMDRTFDM